MKRHAAATVRADAERLIRLSEQLHAHPETAWEEHRSSRWVAESLAEAGFAVTPAYLGLETAFHATIGSGPFRLGLCAEYDALPGLGHACGHNLISAITVGAARALAPLADEAGLTIEVYGTPAEEGGGGKIEMLDRDGFPGVHAAAMVHPGPVDVARAEPYAVSHSHIRFDGKAAHAGASREAHQQCFRLIVGVMSGDDRAKRTLFRPVTKQPIALTPSPFLDCGRGRIPPAHVQSRVSNAEARADFSDQRGFSSSFRAEAMVDRCRFDRTRTRRCCQGQQREAVWTA